MAKSEAGHKTPNVLVIELVNRQNSNYYMDQVGSDDMMDARPEPINCPSAVKIKSRSVRKVYDDKEKVWRHEPIRYIAGCDEIVVSKQDAMGIKPNPPLDVIWILHGKLTVTESGADIGKYRYLKAYEGNVDNENRPDGAEDKFREISTSVEAQQDESVLDSEYEVLQYLNSLKTKTTSGETEYNEDQLEMLSSLFRTGVFDSGYGSEAWVALAGKAKDNPSLFLQTIKAKTALVETDVLQAIQLGAIVFDQNRAVFEQGAKFIQQFPASIKDDARAKKLVEFFCNPRNSVLYDELKTHLQVKKQARTSVVS
jgi:hypothetical protein